MPLSRTRDTRKERKARLEKRKMKIRAERNRHKKQLQMIHEEYLKQQAEKESINEEE